MLKKVLGANWEPLCLGAGLLLLLTHYCLSVCWLATCVSPIILI